MNKNKTIFSQRLAAYLMDCGFVLCGMKRDSKGTGKNVFYFKETPELIQAIFDYSNLKKK